jgi:hypothetical protein
MALFQKARTDQMICSQKEIFTAKNDLLDNYNSGFNAAKPPVGAEVDPL